MKHLIVLSSLVPFVFGAVFTVGVGKDETTGKKGLGFDPSSIHPAAGDTIVFEFRSGSHSVLQSTFTSPCTSNGGFNSGVKTVDDNLEVDAPGLPTVSLLVNDTQPLWFFDDAGGLCNKGAVLSVNPTQTQSDAQFKANSLTAPNSGSGSGSGSQSSAPAPSGPSGSASGNPQSTASGGSAPSGQPSSPAQSPAPNGAAATGSLFVLYLACVGLLSALFL
ncbi:SH3 domain-containing protein [Mycena indigotica]|uniref:SH3 domain-containing protein n=1 Tax=Mycena indigotica TaxID=2126181 RepID=A0A8H6SCZ9_9AGAR|nr:SH3 domain-containing protein [Mycena indigotica]KAF7297193.1 SH3 domain-containing protein [Mycena indigotica]